MITESVYVLPARMTPPRTFLVTGSDVSSLTPSNNEAFSLKNINNRLNFFLEENINVG